MNDIERHKDRQVRKYRRRQHQLELLGLAVQITADGFRAAKRRWWPSYLIAILLDRDLPRAGR